MSKGQNVYVSVVGYDGSPCPSSSRLLRVAYLKPGYRDHGTRGGPEQILIGVAAGRYAVLDMVGYMVSVRSFGDPAFTTTVVNAEPVGLTSSPWASMPSGFEITR